MRPSVVALLAASCSTAAGESVELTAKNFEKKVCRRRKVVAASALTYLSYLDPSVCQVYYKNRAAFIKFQAPW